MALDLSKLTAERRLAFIRVGKQYSSTDTLRQAALTLQGFARYGKQVGDFGFVQKDADALAAAQDELVKKSSGREDRRAGRRQTAAAFEAAIRAGKRARQQARAVLQAVESELLDSGDAAAPALGSVLVHTRSAGSDSQSLSEQLGQLERALGGKDVAALAKTRGGPAAVAALKAAQAGIASVVTSLPASSDTTDVTEQMDLLDGYIVELVRRARRAARAAAQALGQPDLARAFELSALYSSSAGGDKPDEPPTPPTPPSP
ncbi:MAG: hypothetical protein U1A78_13260 [Polyangia bacterium]